MAPQFPALRLGEISPNRTTVYNIKNNSSRIFPLFVLYPLIVMSPNRNADCIFISRKKALYFSTFYQILQEIIIT